MSKSRSLFEFYEPWSRVTTASTNKSGNSSRCNEDDGVSAALQSSLETDPSSVEYSVENVDDAASRDSAHIEQSLEQDDNSHESLDLLQEAIRQSRALNDHEKYQLLISVQGLTDDDLDTRYFSVTGGRKRKQITFQRRWLQDYKWLRYGVNKDYQGGWCLRCILFPSGSEKATLGAFVCIPFTNYNKSK